MFIEAGTYFFEQPVERALAAWSTSYGDPESRWANLLGTSMVKELYKTELNDSWLKHRKYKVVWMHEHLREFAQNLLKGAERSWPVGGSYRSVDPFNANTVNTKPKTAPHYSCIEQLNAIDANS